MARGRVKTASEAQLDVDKKKKVFKSLSLDNDPINMMVDENKLKLSMEAMAFKYNEKVRMIIEKTYNDMELYRIYQAIRNLGVYQKGGKTHRKVIEFPNPYVFDFVDTVMTGMYGENWITDQKLFKKASQHELVRPWLVVNKV